MNKIYDNLLDTFTDYAEQKDAADKAYMAVLDVIYDILQEQDAEMYHAETENAFTESEVEKVEEELFMEQVERSKKIANMRYARLGLFLHQPH